MLFFDAKTRKFSGELEEMTKEEVEHVDDLMKRGILRGNRHPSEEELKKADEFYERVNMAAEMEKGHQRRMEYERKKKMKDGR